MMNRVFGYLIFIYSNVSNGSEKNFSEAGRRIDFKEYDPYI